MEMSKPKEEHRKLHQLAGTWKSEETMYPSPWDPKGGTATGKTVSRMDLDGFFLISEYVQERCGQVSYRGHGVFGWSDKEKAYTMHWFDSMGSDCATPARGEWSGNTLTFLQKTPMGHARYVYTLEGEGRYRFALEQSQDGKSWSKFMEGKYARA